MLNIYKTDIETGKFSKTDKFERGVWINLINPTDDEVKKVCKNVNIEEEFIRYPLDYEEQPRIDQEDEAILFVIDIPTVEPEKEERIYETMPLGMIVVRDDYFITVCLKQNKIIEQFEKGRIKSFYTYKKTRFIFQILYFNSANYLHLLKRINKETEVAEGTLKKSMRNREVIKMLNMEKSLVYFTTSLKSNEVVMEKTLRGKVLKLYEEDEDLLEDAIVENKQAIEMSKIYSDILNGSMDAYASIISNNLNSVMKFLTSVTIVLSVPTMIGSFWGMNVPLPFAENAYGFPIVMGISAIIALISAWLLKRKNMF